MIWGRSCQLACTVSPVDSKLPGVSGQACHLSVDEISCAGPGYPWPFRFLNQPMPHRLMLWRQNGLYVLRPAMG